MPIYEYQCAACQRTFEAWQKASEAPIKKCELCGSPKVSKIISQSTFHLKGSGWYVTDYSRKGSSGSSPKAEKKETKSESTSAPAAPSTNSGDSK
jgi:putative FmdB family regulatory protein